jgi:hypothetical protein
MDWTSPKALNSESCLGFGAYPGQALTHLAEFGGGHVVGAEKPFEHPSTTKRSNEFTVDTTGCATFGNRHKGLSETLRFFD